MIGLELRMRAFVDGCVGHLKHDKKGLDASFAQHLALQGLRCLFAGDIYTLW